MSVLLQYLIFVEISFILPTRFNAHQAVELMIKNTGMTRKEAEDEVDRYCVLPAQACAYKVCRT